MSRRPIGIFDSGIGGLSVLRHIQALLPNERLLYVADQANVPYGSKPQSEIRRLSEGITRFLFDQDAKLIVVACNTASAAALTYLRQKFPSRVFVGMEPAVKPAVLQTQSGKVGVLATAGTFQSERYVNLTNRFASGVTVLEDPCIGLVDLIEAGEIDTAPTEALLRQKLTPMLKAGVDTVILGCTHYPFVKPVIERIVGDAAVIVDPAPAVARQTGRMLEQHQLLASDGSSGGLTAYTTGDVRKFTHLTRQLLGYVMDVHAVTWRDSRIDTA